VALASRPLLTSLAVRTSHPQAQLRSATRDRFEGLLYAGISDDFKYYDPPSDAEDGPPKRFQLRFGDERDERDAREEYYEERARGAGRAPGMASRGRSGGGGGGWAEADVDTAGDSRAYHPQQQQWPRSHATPPSSRFRHEHSSDGHGHGNGHGYRDGHDRRPEPTIHLAGDDDDDDYDYDGSHRDDDDSDAEGVGEGPAAGGVYIVSGDNGRSGRRDTRDASAPTPAVTSSDGDGDETDDEGAESGWIFDFPFGQKDPARRPRPRQPPPEPPRTHGRPVPPHRDGRAPTARGPRPPPPLGPDTSPETYFMHLMQFDEDTDVTIVKNNCICNFWDALDYRF